MTNKQIIIDGCDVSGCPHLIEDYQWWNIAGREEHDINRCALSFDGYIDFEEDDFCKENPNCYYKQHKRAENQIVELNKKVEAKEQEREELNLENFALKDRLQHTEFVLKTANKTIKLNEQQLDQLKQECEELKEQLELNTANAVVIDMAQRLFQLKQVLKEIKEIVCLELAYGTNEEYANFYMQQREAILLKISECEV